MACGHVTGSSVGLVQLANFYALVPIFRSYGTHRALFGTQHLCSTYAQKHSYTVSIGSNPDIFPSSFPTLIHNTIHTFESHRHRFGCLPENRFSILYEQFDIYARVFRNITFGAIVKHTETTITIYSCVWCCLLLLLLLLYARTSLCVENHSCGTLDDFSFSGERTFAGIFGQLNMLAIECAQLRAPLLHAIYRRQSSMCAMNHRDYVHRHTADIFAWVHTYRHNRHTV